MEVRVLDNKAIISGYVNVAERISKRLKENGTEFYEKVKQTIIAYSQIPTVVKEKFKWKEQKTEKKSKETKEGEK